MQPQSKVRKFNLHPERQLRDHVGVRRHRARKPSGRKLDAFLRGTK